MTAAVVDASAVMAWLWPPQANAASDRLRARLSEFEMEAPFIFDWEVRNLLLRMFGRGPERLLYDEALNELAAFEITLGEPRLAADMGELGRSAGLTLFDAAYLGHAMEGGLSLISRDKALVAAAKAHRVPVFDLT